MQAVKGMRDFYPQDYRYREWLFNIFKQVSFQCGFEFFDAAVVEEQELFVRKAGEEITQQIYTLKDKSERELALRPEMTPTLARMVIAKAKELPGRIKWGAIAQCFRYERMTRGRKREHYQWNLDILGDDSMMAETELIITAILALEKMGLDSNLVRVRISNRLLLSELLLGYGVKADQLQNIFMVVDKLSKVSDEDLVKMMKDGGLEDEFCLLVMELIRLQNIAEVEKRLVERNITSKGYEDVKTLFSLISAYGYSDYLQFDLSIVRGLAYYTGTVFEFFDSSRNLRAIAGGGRYDNLIENLSSGSVKMPAVGFGFGDVVIMELLSDLQKLPVLEKTTDWYLIPFSQEEVPYLLPVLKRLRENGESAELHYPPQKIRKMMAQAEKLKAKKVVIAGEQERLNQTVKIKNLSDSTEEEKAIREIF